jgi:hypothetical protein
MGVRREPERAEWRVAPGGRYPKFKCICPAVLVMLDSDVISSCYNAVI